MSSGLTNFKLHLPNILHALINAVVQKYKFPFSPTGWLKGGYCYPLDKLLYPVDNSVVLVSTYMYLLASDLASE